MSMYVTARGGTPLPALGPRVDDDLGTLSPLSRVRSVPTESPSPPADSSMRASYSRTARRGFGDAAGSTRGFGNTRTGAADGSDGYMEQTGGWSVRHTQSGLQRGGEGASMRRSRSTFNPYGSMTGTSRHEGDFYQEKMANLPSVGTQSPPRPSTREAIASLRAEGLDTAETQVRKLASLPSANESVEELYRKRGHEDAVPPLQRQIHSMPDLHSDPAKTEASQRYNDDVDRLLRRLLVDVNISHKSLPSLPAQRQICTHLDKVHTWFDRSRSAAKDLMESGGAKKPSTAKSPTQAGIYLPAGSPPLPGSVKWQRPERKKIAKAAKGDSKLEHRPESPAALDDSLADCETGDEGELLDALSDSCSVELLGLGVTTQAAAVATAVPAMQEDKAYERLCVDYQHLLFLLERAAVCSASSLATSTPNTADKGAAAFLRRISGLSLATVEEDGQGAAPQPPQEAETGGEGAADGADAAPAAAEGAAEEAPQEEAAPAAPAAGEGPGEAAIDLVILPEGYGQTKQINIDRPVGKIRGDLEAELSIPDKSLYLMNLSGAVEFKQVLPDDKTLRDLGLKPGDRAGIELRINYYQEQPAEEYVMPDMLDLKVVNEHGEERMVTVHVQRPVMEKPYLGGFRNKVTDSMYHHAVTQTAPVQKKDVHTLRFHREAQTYEYRTRSTQCKRDNGTQMDKVGLYIDCRGDKLMEPRRPYFSSADKAALLLEKCVMIQCHARGMLARRRTRQLRQMRQERHELARKEAERRQLEADLRHKREVERRMHPRTFEDFSVLYKELEAWRVNEAARIQTSGFDEATRRAAQHELLRKETKLLQTIDKLKIQAHTSNRDAKIKSKLESMSQPKVWAQGDGETTTVHTPFTTRAKELMDLYSGLRLPLLTVDERLDVLLHVKWTVKEFDCNLTREMVDLIDREADMLNRGRPEKSFVGLRKRLANLFLQFIETPEFNPEAMKFQKVSREFYDQTGTHPLSTVPIKALGSCPLVSPEARLGDMALAERSSRPSLGAPTPNGSTLSKDHPPTTPDKRHSCLDDLSDLGNPSEAGFEAGDGPSDMETEGGNAAK
ncbi:IQUB [Symbiodinium sp. CCMP2456]|nr:IQUB [Symbiodinium sp. CCMP2456]